MQSVFIADIRVDLSAQPPRLWSYWPFFILCIFLGACDPPPLSKYTITIRVQDDHGSPVAGAQVTVNTKSVGVTNSDGLLDAELIGEEGETRSISALCPSGYRTATEKRSVVLRSFSRLGNGPTAKGPELNWRCLPTERLAALVVRASGQPDIPITLYGRELTRTSPEGTAHALLRLAPGTTVRVALDTSARPGLRPQSPERSFQVDDEDTIFIFNQQFTEIKRPVIRRRPVPKRIIPYRIQ